MKVLLVNDYGTDTGGAELLLLALRDGLRRRGHDARLFASRARPLGRPLLADDSCHGTTGRTRTLLQTANPWAVRALRSTLARFQPDVVHVKLFLTQLSPLILPLLRDVPALYHIAWLRPICPLGTKMRPDGTPCDTPPGAVCYRERCLPLRDWLPLMLQLRLFHRHRDVFDAMVTSSEFMRARLAAEGLEPVDVVPNGVPVRAERGRFAENPLVLFAGRLVPEKGAETLVRSFAAALREVPAARLILFGDGPQREQLARLASEMGAGGSIEFTGHVTRAEIEERGAEAWVQAVPSLWEEPFGLVAVEAMMRGTAVVVSKSGALAEIVDDGRTGLTVPAGDVKALAAALVSLLRDRDRCERLGRAARTVALAKYSEDLYVDRFAAIHERLMRGAGASRAR